MQTCVDSCLEFVKIGVERLTFCLPASSEIEKERTRDITDTYKYSQ